MNYMRMKLNMKVKGDWGIHSDNIMKFGKLGDGKKTRIMRTLSIADTTLPTQTFQLATAIMVDQALGY